MKIFIALIIVLAAAVGIYYWHDSRPLEETYPTPTETSRAMSVEDYIKLNISDLSKTASTTEVLGGTFYVTSVEAHGGAGTVKYEDGHNAYTADFTYTVAENGATTINSFVVRK